MFQQACDELTKISHAESVLSVLRPVPIAAVNVEGPELAAGYAAAVAASKPAAWWRMDHLDDGKVADATGNKNGAVCENGVTVVPPTNADNRPDSRAASLTGGRVKATIADLPDTYSVDFWFYNNLPNSARPITGYLVSRGSEGPEGTPGDSLGISGTNALGSVPPGRLFFYNGGAAKQVAGKTELPPETWHHVVLVRDGKKLAVYLDGNSVPEISGEMEKGYRDGVTQLFIGGRNDNFGNLQGKVAETSVYDRALTPEEVVGHYKAAGPASQLLKKQMRNIVLGVLHEEAADCRSGSRLCRYRSICRIREIDSPDSSAASKPRGAEHRARVCASNREPLRCEGRYGRRVAADGRVGDRAGHRRGRVQDCRRPQGHGPHHRQRRRAACFTGSASFCTRPRTAAMDSRRVTWRGVSVPKMPVRGMYLATHFATTTKWPRSRTSSATWRICRFGE